MENETLYQQATRIVMALRDLVGSDVKGISKPREDLMRHELLAGMDDETFIAAAKEAQRHGWVRVRDAIGKPAFSLMMMETGQKYLDHLGV
jgi:hypothetical protein